ncbi:hypothetical protein RFI_12165 [Reticulomyxa filosa]|uniref:Caspase family p20 domain-containing protein n=1 Tax=Reticulomyxa filosa TaxID=46433 RepID=X6NGF3_RETFI|nr:hypothetical protein RFI_12165 [Reticulomyxa filosa]|eukprot:ETO24978.1 hypothetical protein RFI_12165 [Reticulomyxa filosa]
MFIQDGLEIHNKNLLIFVWYNTAKKMFVVKILDFLNAKHTFSTIFLVLSQSLLLAFVTLFFEEKLLDKDQLPSTKYNLLQQFYVQFVLFEKGNFSTEEKILNMDTQDPFQRLAPLPVPLLQSQCVFHKHEILICGSFQSNNCYSYDEITNEYKSIYPFPKDILLAGHYVIKLMKNNDPNETTLLSFGGVYKHALVMRYSDQQSRGSKSAKDFGQWLPFTGKFRRSVVLGRKPDDYNGVRAVLGGSNNHLLFITYSPKNIDVFDLNKFQYVKHGTLPTDDNSICYHCFVLNTDNRLAKNKKTEMTLFCRKTGLSIEYDETNNEFTFQKLQVCSTIQPFNGYGCVRINDAILFFGGWDALSAPTDAVHVYSISKGEWTKAKYTLPIALSGCMAILNEDRTHVHVLGGYDGEESIYTHLRTAVGVWVEDEDMQDTEIEHSSTIPRPLVDASLLRALNSFSVVLNHAQPTLHSNEVTRSGSFDEHNDLPFSSSQDYGDDDDILAILKMTAEEEQKRKEQDQQREQEQRQEQKQGQEPEQSLQQDYMREDFEWEDTQSDLGSNQSEQSNEQEQKNEKNNDEELELNEEAYVKRKKWMVWWKERNENDKQEMIGKFEQLPREDFRTWLLTKSKWKNDLKDVNINTICVAIQSYIIYRPPEEVCLEKIQINTFSLCFLFSMQNLILLCIFKDFLNDINFIFFLQLTINNKQKSTKLKELTFKELLRQSYHNLEDVDYENIHLMNLKLKIVDMSDQVIGSDEDLLRAFEKEELSFKVVWNAAAQAASTTGTQKLMKKALVIMVGISEYSESGGWPSLKNVKDKDIKNFKDLFEKELKFTFVCNDSEKMTQEDVKDFVEGTIISHKLRKNANNYDGLIMVICGHGDDGNVLVTSEGKSVSIDEIRNAFNCHRMKSFQEFPKIFIVDACRGRNTPKAHQVIFRGKEEHVTQQQYYGHNDDGF